VRRGLAALPAAWLLAFLAVPTALLAARGLSADGLRLLSDGSAWTLLGRSFGVAALATLLCLAAAYPVAWFIATSPPGRRAALLLLVVLPFWTNQLVRTYSLMVVLRPLGLLHTPAAVVIGLVHSFLPFMVLPLATAIERIPPRLLEAAADLGATPAQVFRRVAFPLSMPGVGAGCLLVFLPAVGIFALPEFLGGARLPLVGNQVNLLFKQDPASPPGSALTLVLMALTAALTALYFRARKTEGLA
jgi:spermidine/putrescine transport system permease protein